MSSRFLRDSDTYTNERPRSIIRRRDADTYIGVAAIAMAIISLIFLTITNASNFWLILAICIVAGLAGSKIADMLV